MKQKGKSQTKLRLLQVIQPFDGKFEKKSLPHVGSSVPKERHFQITAGGVTAAWTKNSRDLGLELSGGHRPEFSQPGL